MVNSAHADRVQAAKRNTAPAIKKLFPEGLSRVRQIYFRAFKQEKVLELWAGSKRGGSLRLVKSYRIAGMSGGPGPKRMKGDKQVPEGVYSIDRFNPLSRFHLSLGINYPNASDRARTTAADPGHDIFIHGNKVSIGCLAMTDAVIEEIYVIANSVRRHGAIRVDIFPFRMDVKFNPPKAHAELWSELQAVFLAFENGKVVPRVKISGDGRYVVLPERIRERTTSQGTSHRRSATSSS